MKSIIEIVERRPWTGWLLYGVTAVGVFLLGLLGASILQRRNEAFQVRQVQPIAAWEPRNEVWGANYPRQYETYRKTRQTDFVSKYGGAGFRDYLEESPHLVVLWAGYGFAKAYEQGRGHAYAVEDIRNTFRTNAGMPGTCWACKSTDVPRVMKELGVSEFYGAKWEDHGAEVVNAIGCQDCHDPANMNLRISRPALVEAFRRMGKDINQATHQEMRSLVCAQCHVEYYFAKEPKNYLTFPWDQGFSADEMEAYYDSIDFTDWTHALSRAPMLKAQHPDYELYRTGIHAERGVACADCHMPYRSEGGVKFTDHHVSSPLRNIAGSCAVCHRESEETLRKNVYDRQDRVAELRELVETQLTRLHIEAKAAWDAGATQEEMQPVLRLIRHAQWRWDWVAASNGMGFHSPQVALRVLGTSLDKAAEGRLRLAKILWSRGMKEEVPLPDLSTKAKAQAYVGLDPKVLEQQKEKQRAELFAVWLEKAAARQSQMPTPANVAPKQIDYGR